MALTLYRHFQRNGGLNQILRRQTFRFHYGLKVPVVTVMVFNGTFNNFSVILWRSVLLVEETGVAEEKHRPKLNAR